MWSIGVATPIYQLKMADKGDRMTETREELVSTLMDLSETLCEKAMAIEEAGVAKGKKK